MNGKKGELMNGRKIILKRFFLFSVLAAAGSALSFSVSLTRDTPLLLLEYRFNETGLRAANSGYLNEILEFRSYAVGSPLVDAHSADGLGVSGLPGDRAFDNSAAVMGGTSGSVARTVGDVDAIDQLVSFTISAWYKTSGTNSLIGSNTRFLMDYTANTLGWQIIGNNNTTTPGLNIYVDGGSRGITSPLNGTVLAQTGTWVFIAMTYDGTLTSNNLKLYGGSKTNSVVLLTTQTINSGALEDNDQPFCVGNSSGRDRAFSGYIDNVRLHGTKTAGDNSGALSSDQLESIRAGYIFDARSSLPLLTIENNVMEVSFDQEKGVIQCRDKRTGYIWEQIAPDSLTVKNVVPLRQSAREMSVRIEMVNGYSYTLSLEVESARPELLVSLEGQTMPALLYYPYPFYPETNADFLMSYKSGLLMPVTDDIFFSNSTRTGFRYFEGHTSSMPFYGLINPDGSGLMRLVETPNDAAYRLEWRNGRLVNQIVWHPQFGELGYARKLRYILFDSGGYVAMAHRFREYAEQEGMVKTLREKAAENPDVDKLVGAAAVWNHDPLNDDTSILPIAEEMVSLGMERMIFAGKSPWWNNMSTNDIQDVNALGYLSSRYDIYSDVFDETMLNKVHVNPSWPQDAWPDDAIMNKDGSYRDGWQARGYDGNLYPCRVVTDLNRINYARARISEELATKPYLCRFIDTEAATEWMEDYNPAQPMTRTQSRAGRISTLNYVMNDAGLITGSEGLQCYTVPYVHYFEGVGPVEPFRIELYGSDIFENFEQPGFEFPPEFAALLEVSHRYLVPLWDLVFHDCVVTYPRWEVGPHNKYPVPLWVEKGILQNVLCGRPSLFAITPEYWAKAESKQLIKQIYDAEYPVARATGYSRMINHEFLTPDKSVQRTVFDNGITVTVNFGDTTYSAMGTVVAPWSYQVDDPEN